MASDPRTIFDQQEEKMRFVSETLETALATYGIQIQLRQLQEECGELITSVNHLFRGRIEPVELLNELADVEIMIKQIKLFYDNGQYERVFDRKINNLAERLAFDCLNGDRNENNSSLERKQSGDASKEEF